jgi:hypothetical protein
MRFGMGITLTEEEDAQIAEVVKLGYAACALANDYFSFDREYAQLEKAGTKTLTNSIWLSMQWHNVGVETAKQMVRDVANQYEKRFLELSEQFRREHAPVSAGIDLCLRGASYAISGHIVWMINAPRYFPEARYDPNAGVEDILTARLRPDNIRGTQQSAVAQGRGSSLPEPESDNAASIQPSFPVSPRTSTPPRSSASPCSSTPERGECKSPRVSAPARGEHQLSSPAGKRTLLDPNVSGKR